MTTHHTVAVRKLEVDTDQLGYFRFGKLADGVMLSNEYGEWHHLDQDTFETLLAGKLSAEHEQHEPLSAKGFLRESIDMDAFADAMRRRKRFVGLGPRTHTLRIRDQHGDMSIETTKDVIDHAMLSTSSALTLRFTHLNGAADLDLLQFAAQYGTEKNRYEGKALTWELCTSAEGFDAELAKWVVDKRFRVRVAIGSDGRLDDRQAAALALLKEAAAAKRRDTVPFVADVHVGADHADGAAVVAALIEAGVPRCRLHPVLEGDGAIDPVALRSFYAAFLDALLASHEGGDGLIDELTGAISYKALRTDAVDDCWQRSPSGGSTAAYDSQGHIFPSELAADLHAVHEDEIFLLGTAGITSYKDAVGHATRRALTLASTLETLPGYADHWTTPFLGIDPVSSYAISGDLFPKAPTDPATRAHRAIAEALFTKLIASDNSVHQLLAGLLA